MLVGTHRILSRDVIPKQLGLVIVDEEQRFGVAQKELLRALRLEVDVLALSATPIPRTLHMSLSGLRDISIIETPPEGRRPIRTTVGEYDEELVRLALEREHARGGQSFYLHNRVETIDEAAEKLRQLCPGLRFLVAHGQMAERELEERMHAFLAGDADVLVSTTIIESGIDIPQANTLVVERADTLGLAQLYQIRGRVGRSDVHARTRTSSIPTPSELTPEARARLATLADHTELGAGFQIAMRDLEIRGAGDLLGAEQSGHVAALGFELYVEMLNEAVAELSGQARVAARPVRVDARVDAYVPATYIQAEALKIDLHRRIALAEHEDELRELRAATEDRYGPLPEPVENLFRIQEAKLAARARRRRLPRLPRRPGDRRPGRARLATELRALRAIADTAIYTSARAGGRDPRRRARGCAGAGRCYRCRSPGRLSAHRERPRRARIPNLSRTHRNPSVTARRLQRGLDEALARTRRGRSGRCHPGRRRLRRHRRGPGRRGRRRRRHVDHAGRARRAARAGEEVATRHRSATSRRPAPPSTRRCRRRRSPTSSSARSTRSEADEARHQGHGRADRRRRSTR